MFFIVQLSQLIIIENKVIAEVNHVTDSCNETYTSQSCPVNSVSRIIIDAKQPAP